MKLHPWTLALAAAGVVSLASATQAEEAQHQVQTMLSQTTLSGYVDTVAIWKFGTGNNLVGRAFDGTAKQDGFNLNVVKVSLEKPLDEGQWSAGYKVDLLFGPDASGYNPSVGIGNSEVGIKQAYVLLRAPVGNGIDFKIGTWDTCIGYEVFDSVANPNYSRSFAYTIEPLAHTGVMASYKVNDILSFSGGIANTWSTGINTRGIGATESEKTYMALVNVTAPESAGVLSGATLTAGVIDGINNADAHSDTTSWYIGGTTPTPLKGLSAGAAYDYRGTKQREKPFLIRSTYANAIGGYLSWQATEKLKLNGRTEYAWGSDFTWYNNTAVLAAPNNKANNELLGFTATADYSLWANVVTRAEFRWDHVLTGGGVLGAKPYGSDNGDKNAVSLALNVVYKF